MQRSIHYKFNEKLEKLATIETFNDFDGVRFCIRWIGKYETVIHGGKKYQKRLLELKKQGYIIEIF